MANTIITSKMTQILSLEMAKQAGFLKIGAKDYFSSQINGKMRAGKTYTFVLPDAGNVVEGLVASPRDIEEKKVDLTIKSYNNSVQLDALESVTDVKWEDEIAKSYAGKLMNRIVKDAVEDAATKATVAFVGEGFQPLAKAGAHLQSITPENIYGFCDPQMQAVLAANGQMFVPNGAPNDLYGKGHLGTFQGVDYTAERFLKPVVVGELANDATVVSIVDDTLTLSKALGDVKAGTPIWVEGVYACDTIGDETNVLYAFIVKEDASGAVLKVEPVEFEDIGARSISKDPANGKVLVPAAGTYYRALLRADGAYCYSPVNTLDFDLSSTRTTGDTDGIRVFTNSFTDAKTAVNLIRWDHASMTGTVENRGVAIAYVKQ
ncbi:MAG: hypothetical protein MJZ37_06935 [Bacilli bacterium]|nr:hypothetical protein [Bacilli bacterium]